MLFAFCVFLCYHLFWGDSMASIKEMSTKDGKRFYKISVSRGYGKSAYSRRWYPDPLWSSRTVERELRKAAAEFERACAAGEIQSRADKAAERAKLQTVRQYCENIFFPAKAITVSANTQETYRVFLDRHIYPAIGDALIQEVTPAQLQKLLLDYQSADYSFSSVKLLYSILSGIFKMAFNGDTIKTNPMHRVEPPKQPRADEAETGVRALTADELRYVLSCADSEPLLWQAFIYLAADTGARVGELCGLQWADLSGDTLTIQRNLQYTPGRGIYTTTTKSGKARIGDTGPETLSILDKLRENKKLPSPWIFSQAVEPVNPNTVYYHFKSFGQRYGIEDFHPHLLRHSSASISITAGADPVSVAARLGHSNPAMTLKVYSHASAASIRRAGQIARDAVSKSLEKSLEHNAKSLEVNA